MENSTPQTEPVNEPPFYKRAAFIYLAIACVALIVTGIAAIFQKNYPGVKLKDLAAELINHDIPPGGNRATLTLASGKSIVLNEMADGELAREGALLVRKTGNGEIKYEVTLNGQTDQPDGYHTFSTPNGGTYKIILPDGTKVWLNAASTFKFPVNFILARERTVELSGEAYMEVHKDLKHPFKLRTNRQLVHVLGTHFNVDNYLGDVAKTTLLKGSLKINSIQNEKPSDEELTLKAGQQAVLDPDITILKADTTAAIAWKNGLFLCHDEPLEMIMKKVSRWYDVEIIYHNIDSHKLFSVKSSLFEHVSSVLKQLETAGGIHFTIEEGKIMVTK